MAVSDFASAAAAVSGGYVKTQVDRGASTREANRYLTRFEKPITGAPGDSGRVLSAEGESNASAAGADTQAVAALNAVRRHYYAGSPGRASGSAESASGRGGTHTVDVT
jgi:hypothetical protein